MNPRFLISVFIANQENVLFYVKTDQPLVALTIDDGPDPRTTPGILNVLQEFKSQATFFLISDQIPGNTALVTRIVVEQHEIGNHLTKDFPSILLSDEEFERNFLEAHQILKEYGRLCWLRPANAIYKNRMIQVAHQHGYKCALGDVFTLDIIPMPSKWIAKYILATVCPGSIITLHDGGFRGTQTSAVLKLLLPNLKQRGYKVVTLSELSLALDRGT